MLRGFGAEDFPYDLPQPHYGPPEPPSGASGSSSGPSGSSGHYVDLNQPGDIYFDPGDFSSLSDMSDFWSGTGPGDDDAGSGD